MTTEMLKLSHHGNKRKALRSLASSTPVVLTLNPPRSHLGVTSQMQKMNRHGTGWADPGARA